MGLKAIKSQEMYTKQQSTSWLWMLKWTPPAFSFSGIFSYLLAAFPKLACSSDTALNEMERSEPKGQGYMTDSNQNTNPQVPLVVSLLQYSLHPTTQTIWKEPTTLFFFLCLLFIGCLQMIEDMLAAGLGTASVSRAHQSADINTNINSSAVSCYIYAQDMHLFYFFFKVANISLETRMFSSCLRFLVSCNLRGYASQGQCTARGVEVQLTWNLWAAEVFKSACKAQSSNAARLGIIALNEINNGSSYSTAILP